jgi:hypothetical protein
MNDVICQVCDQPCEFIKGRAFTGWVHANTGRLECAWGDGGWSCIPIVANQMTHFDRWNLNVPGPWED